jgi:glycosyltransferase involved in cell wall biosynthesis
MAQTYRNFQVVVSDNCSEGDASAKVESFVRDLGDPRVSYVRQAEDGGEYGQGRYFFAHCNEDYFTILHDDDCLTPQHLEFSVAILEADPDLAFVSSGQIVIDSDGNEEPELTREYNSGEGRDHLAEGRIENPLEILLAFGGIFSISGTVFRFSTVSRNGLVDPDCGGLYPFEFNVFLRQTEHLEPAYFTPRKLVAYRHHAGTMRNYAKPFFNRSIMSTLMRLLERRKFSGRAERRRRKLLAAVYRNYAFILFVADEYAACYRYLGRSIRLYPLSRYIWAYTAVAIVFPFLIRPIWGPRVTLQ